MRTLFFFLIFSHQTFIDIILDSFTDSSFIKKYNTCRCTDLQSKPTEFNTHMRTEEPAECTQDLSSGVCYRNCNVFCWNPVIPEGKFPLQGRQLKYAISQEEKQFTWNIGFPIPLWQRAAAGFSVLKGRSLPEDSFFQITYVCCISIRFPSSLQWASSSNHISAPAVLWITFDSLNKLHFSTYIIFFP